VAKKSSRIGWAKRKSGRADVVMEGSVDKDLVVVVGTTFSKITFYICCTVMLSMWFSSCELNDTVITSCQSSCKGWGSHMESVTTRECICASASTIEPLKNDIWVLPRGN